MYRLLYKCFCAVSYKHYICFVECGTSRYYSNIDAVFEKMTDMANVICIDGKKCSIYEIWKVSRAKVLVMDQASPLISNLCIDKKTQCVQVWHSSGLYKHIGFDALRHGFSKASEIKRIKRVHGNINWFIISDKKLIDAYANAFGIAKDHVLPLGLARTDYLYKCNIQQVCEKFSNIFPETKGKRKLLYAPTFRSSDTGEKRTHTYQLDLAFLQAQLGHDWCFFIRRHPSVTEKAPDNWIDVSYLPQEECLAVADVLVTDYSSILFDYSFFKRPIFLFINDIETYKKQQRDLYVTPEDLVGKENVCHSAYDIVQKLKKIENKDNYIWENYMSACDGSSSVRVANFIKKLSGRV